MQSVIDKTFPYPINCWGTALWSQGFINELRPSTKSELLYTFKKNKCRKLQPNEAPLPGDFGSFYNSESGIYHTFIHLDDTFIFEKGSPYPSHVPEIENYKEKFKDFSISFDLKTGCKSGNENECFWGVINYRCDTFNVLAEQATEKTEKFDGLLHTIKRCLKDSTCKQDYILALETFIDILIKDIRHPDSLSFESYRAIGVLLLFANENKDFIQHLPLAVLEKYMSLLNALESLENNTFKKLSDFPDFAKSANASF
ncbi:MAG: hypothetical protein KDD61_16400 [Bdellovibrionales bacterium]|nr:hypothetical protein [Bdellovibrionales bacterium]